MSGGGVLRCDAEDCHLQGRMKKKAPHRMLPDVIKDDVKTWFNRKLMDDTFEVRSCKTCTKIVLLVTAMCDRSTSTRAR